ncbi:PRC-barrel domain-containing protein [Sphingomonas sp. IC-56]|uniref:PRC-barrel domain-containing protein n=1 Tax=Sphingomonas sp. IC-56 TaxID=2898529 RepID=UPI001E578C7D|nr:PRC-barrel domain-containing protein [Sphingomonas sp. IC-56]MCD2323648.1 PRC-barrel domain-containing protein [Sphingomonas sp. IC-56]
MTDLHTAEMPDAIDVAHQLISSRRIEGTPVFDRRGTKVGAIHSVMIEKVSGQATHAVLTFGGFLGLGTRAYPIPWSMLTYSKEERGYCLHLKREDIEDAPYMTLDQADRPQLTQEPAYRHWDEYL